jgi:hypothetical protein
MFLFNLSLFEFFALLGSLSSVVVALYLLDRLRKKYTVSTLRFFTALDRVPQYRHRRKLQQPWSLVIQLLSLLLLLLALAQVRLGSRDRYSRDHVIVLDTSAWMAARSGPGRLIDRARAAAKAYLQALPANDRVMLVRADALATPATLFESDRQQLTQAIDASQPGAAVLNIQQALEFAQQAQRLHAQRPGEIVFVGAGRVLADSSAGDSASSASLPQNLRVIPVNGPAENCGLRKLGLRRSPVNPDVWEIFVAVKNYGPARRSVPLVVQFGGATIGTRRLDLAPGAEESAAFQYSTRAAGWLEARLLTREAFSLDDRALLELPAREELPVTIYSDHPELLKPVFTAIPAVKAQFLPTARYTAKSNARVVVFDRFSPPEPPAADTIWIQPPPGRSPVAVKSSGGKVKLARWRSDHSLAAGLRTKGLELEKAEVFRADPGDIAVAESDAGPLIVARPGRYKMVALGFHPVESAIKYELTTPLLFANIMRWMAPDTFRTHELTAGTVGTVSAELESETDPAAIRVVTENQRALPFTLDGRTLRFFSGNPGVVRVSTGDRELDFSLTLPQAGDVVWKPEHARTGIPRRNETGPGSRDIWQWLALLGGIGLLADWLLFGRAMRRLSPGRSSSAGITWRKAS